MEAFWKHDGRANRPHALLTKGGHSDGFFNWSMVAQFPLVEKHVVADLFERLNERTGLTPFPFSAVCAPGNGAITLSQSLAREMGEKIKPRIRGIFTEKKDGRVCLDRFSVKQGEHVIVCEDTITSGGSVTETIRAVEAAGGICSPFILCVCNRSGTAQIGEREIIPLIEVPMNNWAASECPLCKQGSKAIPPKKENWQHLTGG